MQENSEGGARPGLNVNIVFISLSVSTDLEVEKLNCAELKKTWELANAHFIVAQDTLKQEIYRLHQKLERGEAVR